MIDRDAIRLSDELLTVMRAAARYAVRFHEPFVSSRSVLLALLDDPTIGSALETVVSREKLEALPLPSDPRKGLMRIPEPGLISSEQAAIPRYDTLAFKLPDGSTSVWLGRDAYVMFNEGAQRAEGTYLPKHLAFGIAAEALRSPGVLAELRVEPGRLTDAIYNL